MQAWEAINLAVGTPVHIHNKSRLDHAFEGKTGIVVNPHTPNGYIRIHLDGWEETATVLVHPESVQVIPPDYEIEANENWNR